MAKKSGLMLPDPYNETEGGPDSPDDSGAGNYVSYDEVMSVHLQSGDIAHTPNTDSGHGIMGGPAPGEPNPAEMSRPGEGVGRK